LKYLLLLPYYLTLTPPIRGVLVFFRGFLNIYVIYVSILHLPSEDSIRQITELANAYDQMDHEEIELEEIQFDYTDIQMKRSTQESN
jgi:hypothetical protein